MPLLEQMEKPLKPAEFAERKILEAILDRSYEPGDALPGERVLAQSLGVTRPTLRETLQRLAREGWVTIAHGKPTRVNDYLSQGGLGILTTLAKYGDYLSWDMVLHLLKARCMILPGAARQAVENDPMAIVEFLDTGLPTSLDPASFARFDWELQTLMVKTAKNPVLIMIFNDFARVYHLLGEGYFMMKKAEKSSRQYYSDLKMAIEKGEDVYGLVESAMVQAHDLWEAEHEDE
ncbi:MAG: GntR family transcriptional regulator [Desulfobacter sp.]|nr:MAG: GntR family transcriptional regulator [Desulfobacter sp.]